MTHPAAQWLAAGLVLAEGLVLAGVAVVLSIVSLRDPNDKVAASLGVVAVALLIGGGLAWCARGLLAGDRWSRGPVVTWQLVQAGVGMPLVFSSAWWLGVPMLGAGVAVLALVVSGRVIPREPS